MVKTRNCEFCKRKLTQRLKEINRNFEKRRFCNQSCAGKANARRMWKGHKFEKACVICGGVLKQYDPRRQTCKDEACMLILTLNPHLAEPGRYKGRVGSPPNKERKAAHRRARQRSRLTKDLKGRLEEGSKSLCLTDSGWVIRGTHDTLDDLRGSARPAGQKALWSFISRREVFIRAISRRDSTPSLVLHRRKKETTQDAMRRLFIGDQENHRMCEMFYAWGCHCDNRHTVSYATLEDLPTDDGYHDACPMCGSAPLEVRTHE